MLNHTLVGVMTGDTTARQAMSSLDTGPGPEDKDW